MPLEGLFDVKKLPAFVHVVPSRKRPFLELLLQLLEAELTSNYSQQTTGNQIVLPTRGGAATKTTGAVVEGRKAGSKTITPSVLN